ncbi:hypothetical protein ACFX11_013211 [Malus domestica]
MAFLAGGVPNLGLDDLSSTRMLLVANSTPMVDLDSRLNSFFVNRQKVRFFNARVTDQHHLEQVIVIVVGSVRLHLLSKIQILQKKGANFRSWVCLLLLIWKESEGVLGWREFEDATARTVVLQRKGEAGGYRHH